MVGAELATNPDAWERLVEGRTKVSPNMLARINALLVTTEAAIVFPKDFVIPGSSKASSAIELARTIIRRAERWCVTLGREGLLPGDHLLAYMNRLADLLWLRAMLLSWVANAIPELEVVITKHLATHKQFTRVFDTIERELGADLRMSEVARSHGTGVEAFSMAFSRATGMSPKDYVTRRLNQEALQLVINTDLKMKEIAERLRFTDEFYFSRFFKKLNGCPPSTYRHKMRGLRAGGQPKPFSHCQMPS